MAPHSGGSDILSSTKSYFMKTILLFLCVTLNIGVFAQFKDYEGEWRDAGQDYEYTLILEKIESSLDKYKFTFFGWRISYDYFTRERVRFGGEMSNEIFTITLDNNQAYYDDDIRQFPEGESLYYEGEDKCAIEFLFKDNMIVVKTTSCMGIYSGYNVFFDGVYERFEN